MRCKGPNDGGLGVRCRGCVAKAIPRFTPERFKVGATFGDKLCDLLELCAGFFGAHIKADKGIGDLALLTFGEESIGLEPRQATHRKTA